MRQANLQLIQEQSSKQSSSPMRDTLPSSSSSLKSSKSSSRMRGTIKFYSKKPKQLEVGKATNLVNTF